VSGCGFVDGGEKPFSFEEKKNQDETSSSDGDTDSNESSRDLDGPTRTFSGQISLNSVPADFTEEARVRVWRPTRKKNQAIFKTPGAEYVTEFVNVTVEPGRIDGDGSFEVRFAGSEGELDAGKGLIISASLTSRNLKKQLSKEYFRQKSPIVLGMYHGTFEFSDNASADRRLKLGTLDRLTSVRVAVASGVNDGLCNYDSDSTDPVQTPVTTSAFVEFIDRDLSQPLESMLPVQIDSDDFADYLVRVLQFCGLKNAIFSSVEARNKALLKWTQLDERTLKAISERRSELTVKRRQATADQNDLTRSDYMKGLWDIYRDEGVDSEVIADIGHVQYGVQQFYANGGDAGIDETELVPFKIQKASLIKAEMNRARLVSAHLESVMKSKLNLNRPADELRDAASDLDSALKSAQDTKDPAGLRGEIFSAWGGYIDDVLSVLADEVDIQKMKLRSVLNLALPSSGPTFVPSSRELEEVTEIADQSLNAVAENQNQISLEDVHEVLTDEVGIKDLKTAEIETLYELVFHAHFVLRGDSRR
jgi:hypothetical protein